MSEVANTGALSAPEASKRDEQFIDDLSTDILLSTSSRKQTEAENEYRGLVALPYDEFESFLSEQENEYWLVDKQSIEEFIPGRPVTVEELMQAIAMSGDGTERIYLFRGDTSPEEVLEATNWNTIPQIKKEDLLDYIVSIVGRAKDFLWFDCTPEEASNGNPAVLLRYEDESLR